MSDYAELDVVFDCADPDRVARFWMTALAGYDFPHGPPDGFATWEEWADANGVPDDQRNVARTLVDKVGNRPTIFFNRVPEAKAGKNRLHLDVKVARDLSGDARRARIEAEAVRLAAADATRAHVVDGPEGFWIVLCDPEGNEFCVV